MDKNFIKIRTFIAELFTIAKTWRQPKCPLTDVWIKKDVRYIYIEDIFNIFILYLFNRHPGM